MKHSSELNGYSGLKNICKSAAYNLMSWNEEIHNVEDVVRLHSHRRTLWDICWITTCAQANSCREDNLHLECIKRTVIKGNGSVVVSAAQALDMELCPAARTVHQGAWVGQGHPWMWLESVGQMRCGGCWSWVWSACGWGDWVISWCLNQGMDKRSSQFMARL